LSLRKQAHDLSVDGSNIPTRDPSKTPSEQAQLRNPARHSRRLRCIAKLQSVDRISMNIGQKPLHLIATILFTVAGLGLYEPAWSAEPLRGNCHMDICSWSNELSRDFLGQRQA
jgi:hypothetical protein